MHHMEMDYLFKNIGGIKMEDYIINFHITQEQAEIICEHFNKNLNDLEEYEVCELLDQIIDEL